ncbi:hypothetical protein BDV98DRAFT_571439 [Pterulicium gracile]|uniref:Uncharacterized protein n=1 Tax=Pterulicium gracile TaxID=1884261 RepID=A0A5C3QFU2_9AGAR|nr:hypothetical protein BDV98DRAFT_571439 [Pterula gracilis]
MIKRYAISSVHALARAEVNRLLTERSKGPPTPPTVVDKSFREFIRRRLGNVVTSTPAL